MRHCLVDPSMPDFGERPPCKPRCRPYFRQPRAARTKTPTWQTSETLKATLLSARATPPSKSPSARNKNAPAPRNNASGATSRARPARQSHTLRPANSSAIATRIRSIRPGVITSSRLPAERRVQPDDGVVQIEGERHPKEIRNDERARDFRDREQKDNERQHRQP